MFNHKLKLLAAIGILLLLVGVGIFVNRMKIKTSKAEVKPGDIMVPTIVNGELMLPQTGLNLKIASDTAAAKGVLGPQLLVASANLIGIYTQTSPQSAQPTGSLDPDSEGYMAPQQPEIKLTGIRILGEMRNGGSTKVYDFIPVIRFVNIDGHTISQKIGHYHTNFSFFGLDPDDQQLYDVSVEDPPIDSDRVELVLRPQDSQDKIEPHVLLKISSRSAEPQTVQVQGQGVEVFVITGKVVNSAASSVSDMAIMAWIKDKENKVYGTGRQEFKSDLLGPGQDLPFKIMVLPSKIDTEFDSFEVRAWGKEYKL